MAAKVHLSCSCILNESEKRCRKLNIYMLQLSHTRVHAAKEVSGHDHSHLRLPPPLALLCHWPMPFRPLIGSSAIIETKWEKKATEPKRMKRATNWLAIWRICMYMYELCVGHITHLQCNKPPASRTFDWPPYNWWALPVCQRLSNGTHRAPSADPHCCRPSTWWCQSPFPAKTGGDSVSSILKDEHG